MSKETAPIYSSRKLGARWRARSRSDVLFLVPDLFTPSGGMARHSQLVLQVLRSLSLNVTVVSLHDEEGASGDIRGCGGSKSRFIYEALRAVADQPRLVIVEHPRFSDIGLTTALLSRARLLVFGHGIDIWYPLPWSARLALRRANRVVCVSRYTAERATSRQRLQSDRVAVLHSCLPVNSFPAASSDVRAGPSLLTVSRILASENYKGHEAVLDALPALLREFPSLRYDVVGDGNGRARLERLVAERGLNTAVRFHGHVPDEDLSRLYAGADIFILPSTHEGFGLVFLEAMAHGLPVIAARARAVPEVVVDGETGVLLDPERPDAIGVAVTRLLSDDGLRRSMGEAGRTRVQTVFNCDVFRRSLAEQLSALGVPAASLG